MSLFHDKISGGTLWINYKWMFYFSFIIYITFYQNKLQQIPKRNKTNNILITYNKILISLNLPQTSTLFPIRYSHMSHWNKNKITKQKERNNNNRYINRWKSFACHVCWLSRKRHENNWRGQHYKYINEKSNMFHVYHIKNLLSDKIKQYTMYVNN